LLVKSVKSAVNNHHNTFISSHLLNLHVAVLYYDPLAYDSNDGYRDRVHDFWHSR